MRDRFASPIPTSASAATTASRSKPRCEGAARCRVRRRVRPAPGPGAAGPLVGISDPLRGSGSRIGTGADEDRRCRRDRRSLRDGDHGRAALSAAGRCRLPLLLARRGTVTDPPGAVSVAPVQRSTTRNDQRHSSRVGPGTSRNRTRTVQGVPGVHRSRVRTSTAVTAPRRGARAERRKAVRLGRRTSCRSGTPGVQEQVDVGGDVVAEEGDLEQRRLRRATATESSHAPIRVRAARLGPADGGFPIGPRARSPVEQHRPVPRSRCSPSAPARALRAPHARLAGRRAAHASSSRCRTAATPATGSSATARSSSSTSRASTGFPGPT